MRNTQKILQDTFPVGLQSQNKTHFWRMGDYFFHVRDMSDCPLPSPVAKPPWKGGLGGTGADGKENSW